MSTAAPRDGRSPQDRVRFFGLLAGGIGFAVMLPQVLTADLPVGRRVVGVAALVLLVASAIATYRRRRPLPLDVLFVPVLTVLVGANLANSMATMSIYLDVVFSLALYGSHRRALALTVLMIAAIPASIGLHPVAFGHAVSWHGPEALGNLPQMALISVIVRVLVTALQAQEAAARRVALLAGTGQAFLGTRELPALHAQLHDAAAALCAFTPGLAVALAERTPTSARLLTTAGAVATDLGPGVPAEVLQRLAGLAGDDPRPPAGQPDPLTALAPGVRHWRAAALSGGGADVERFLLVGSPAPVRDGELVAFRTLVDQFTLAEASCASHARLSHRASHDELTGLPTRALFLERTIDAVDASVATGTGRASVLNIDLDDFKQVNDRHGHAGGDELLVEIGARMVQVCGPGSVVARFGGDEFAVLLPAALPLPEVHALAQALCARLVEPVHLSTAVVTVGASIGVASWQPPLTAHDLVRCADIAMYSAKARGKNRVEVFEAGRHGDIARHRLMEDHLASAVERGEVVVTYRPAVDLTTGRCVAVEAVPQWDHPTLGPLAAEEFLPLADRSGRLLAIGAHVLRTACADLAGWRTLPGAGEVRLAVDVTARQLTDPAFADLVLGAAGAAGVPLDALVLELVDAHDVEADTAHRQLRELAGRGVRVCVEGFTGGLDIGGALRSFPVHEVKVDGAAVLDPGARAGSGTVLQLATAVSAVLGLPLVAQDVDTPAQAELLRAAGVAAAQGRWVAPAMPRAALAGWLARPAGAVRAVPAG
ncbi:putative bifunctional diguanylate cyclase/phosphodiesterase [Kineococcus radiotolerans]|uniref:Diguanylate cyclase/phosphodiesterase n=1 Tax=Kineococcus radiotolerans (strain ATCC BAA-149 / DSM 14245 / SRS30216) TaxID=266940 RepID=A6W6S5_KINRD|nr:EAL domain-containing protein [Kineococcus radiotolerans]ABS02514.1 diguanylate cyclase/phosphodiesterase [Kineococcus radiotolerans SRS30216 = ATCC BAA-149]